MERIAPTNASSKNLLFKRHSFNARLPKLLKDRSFDLLVGFDIDGYRLIPRKRKCPFVVCIKGVAAEECRQETGRAHWMLRYLASLERRNCRQADLVVTTSEYCRTAVADNYGLETSKIKLVPEGIDLTRWEKINRHNPKKSDGSTILCVARQYRRKRISDLLAALVLVRKEIPRVQAVIIGDGPEHASLRQQVVDLGLSEIVQMTGEIPDDDQVAKLYRRADVFCLPSIQEGFGIVFLEAMAAGLPVISTNSAAIPEVVPHEHAGLLVTPRDVLGLANALVELLRSEQLRNQYGDFGRKYVEQYDWPVVAGMFLGAVESLTRDNH